MANLIDKYVNLVFSYFYVDIHAVEAAVRKIFAEEIESGKYQVRRNILDLKSVEIGNPLAGGRSKKLALAFAPETSPMHCVFVSRSSDGWHTLVNRLNSELKTRCISVGTTSDSADYPANSIRVYESGHDVRLVRAMLDGDRWDFFEKGIIQPFENPGNYKKRKIRDRLSREIVLEYLENIGLDVQAPAFWNAEGDALYICET